MHLRRAGGLTLITGLVLLFTPLYWEVVQHIGLSPVLDPAAAVGAVPSGGYPVAVGGAAIAVGSAVIWCAESGGQPTTIGLVGGFVGAIIATLATTVVASVPFPAAMQVGLAGAAPGFAAVRGAATDRPRRRLGTGLVLLSLAPFAGAHTISGATSGGLAGVASLILVVALVVYTAILSYPFYRLGRAAREAVCRTG